MDLARDGLREVDVNHVAVEPDARDVSKCRRFERGRDNLRPAEQHVRRVVGYLRTRYINGLTELRPQVGFASRPPFPETINFSSSQRMAPARSRDKHRNWWF